MARMENRLPENVPGEFYVDDTCIDCETCMVVAPSVFAESARAMSFVHHQPADARERLRAGMAMIACPTASIGTVGPARAGAAARAFPELLGAGGVGTEPGERERADGVHYCGYAHEDSFGAQSWFVTRAGGNLLVDSPRAAKPLLARMEALGGVRMLFLTHRDDVADHAKFAERFGCERIMHAQDVVSSTGGIERPVEGRDPVRLADDLLLIPVPGHSRGSAALLYRDRYLFTGDHVWGDEHGRLAASRRVSWYSWEEQIVSMERLLEHPFEWVLPGHGRPWKASSPEAAHEEVRRLVARMRARA